MSHVLRISFLITALLALSIESARADSRFPIPDSCPLYLLPEKSETTLRQTTELQKTYREVYSKYEWTKGSQEDFLDFRRLIEERAWTQEARKKKTQIYGPRTWLAFRKADYYLKSIPKGEFKLTLDVIKETHRGALDGVYQGLQKLHFAGLPHTIFKQGGVFKSAQNYGFWSIFHDMSEKEYLGMIDNVDHRFVEFPYPVSRKGKRRGIILYSKASEVESKLQELCDFVNKELSRRDPIEVAAIFQRRFTSIHPFQDANGRTSRLLMDRILLEKDIAPPIIPDHNLDLFSTEKDWINEVRAGARRATFALEQERKELLESTTRPEAYRPVSVLQDGYGQSYAADDAKTPAPINSWKFLNSPHFIEVSGKSFQFNSKGEFLTDRFGQIYVIVDKVVTPVSDHTVLLLNSMLGWSDSSWSIAKNSTQKLLRENIEAAKKKSRSPILDLKLGNMKDTAEANQINTFEIPTAFLKDFNRSPVFRTPRNLWDALILSPRDRQTKVEINRSYARGKIPKINAILAQYQKLQLEAPLLMQELKNVMPEKVPFMQERMKTLDVLVGKQIQQMKRDWDHLSPSDQVLIWNHPLVDETFNFLKYTPFSKIFHGKEFVKDLDTSIYLFRQDSSIFLDFGIYSEAEMTRVFSAIPGVEEMVEKILQDPMKFGSQFNKIISHFTKADKKSFLERITGKNTAEILNALSGKFVSRYERRSAEIEFRRKFVEYYNHAATSMGSEYLSLSSSLELYRQSLVMGDSGYSTDAHSYLYLVRVPKTDVTWNIFSVFPNEYEALAPSRISRSEIIQAIPIESQVERLKDSWQNLSIGGKRFYRSYFQDTELPDAFITGAEYAPSNRMDGKVRNETPTPPPLGAIPPT